MKFSATTLLVLLPLVSQAAAISVPRPRLSLRQDANEDFRRGRQEGGRNHNKNGKNTSTNKAANSASVAEVSGNNTSVTGISGNSTSVTGVSGNSTSTSVAGVSGNNTAAADGSADPQTSLTLDPRVIASGFAKDGQDVPTAGQVASLTSTNNFINFCLTVPNLPITNGKQITTGSCNPAPIGTIPSTDNMPSAKFTFPKNGGTVTANQQFTITMAINNLVTGHFVNADENYFAAPQQLNAQGQIIGHSHVVVEALSSIDQSTPTDPTKFAFFKGLNDVAVNGVLTAAVTSGLPAGAYRLCSINTCANHQPAIVAVAQHGALDDCVYFSATADGEAAAGTGTAANSTVVATTAAAFGAGAAATSAAAASGAGAAVPSVAIPSGAAEAAASATPKSSKFSKNRRYLSRL
ncbi:hypothetical protein E4T56_gene18444 [Termitomyces sp. T112]|nr:hypothetical protein E4T56_gene18444 [Termitomyces sp. T112]KAH0590189.1 hypothetical protein H2248_000362 [Termitomyces sp. 'cryptogamus']